MADTTKLLRQLAGAGALPTAAEPDGELLGRFVDRGDAAAFDALLARHGPMVWGVCRRLLQDVADAEDAFQATFLVLVRKGGSVVPRGRVGNWLYGVACRAALKARTARVRRREHERRAAVPAAAPTADRAETADLAAWIDRELTRLPDRFRAPVVLCELEGLTVREAAARLGCPEGTVASRLSRGRAVLADRLRRRGLPAAAVAGVLTARTVPAEVLAAARAAALGSAAATGPAADIAKGVVTAMFFRKLRVLVVGLALVAAAGGAMARLATEDPPPKSEPKPEAKAAPPVGEKQPDPLLGRWESQDDAKEPLVFEKGGRFRCGFVRDDREWIMALGTYKFTAGGKVETVSSHTGSTVHRTFTPKDGTLVGERGLVRGVVWKRVPDGDPARDRSAFRAVPLTEIDTDEGYTPSFPQLGWPGRYEEARQYRLDPLGRKGWRLVATTPRNWVFQGTPGSTRWRYFVSAEFPDSPLSGQNVDTKRAAEKLASVAANGGEFCGILRAPVPPQRPREFLPGDVGNVAVFRCKNGHLWGAKAEFKIVPAADIPWMDVAVALTRLNALGADGWKLVAATSHAWLFKKVKGGGNWECRVVGDRPPPAEGMFDRAAEVAHGWELTAIVDQDAGKKAGARFMEVDCRRLTPEFGSAAQKEETRYQEWEKLQGRWVLVSVETGGKSRPAAEGEEEVTVAGDNLLYDRSIPKGQWWGDSSSVPFRIDPSASPPAIDFTRRAGGKDVTEPAIYTLEADTLRICTPRPGTPTQPAARPKEFRTTDGATVRVYRRLTR
jgi:RNA polymerase sigma factor (sigma-70 family)